MPGNPPAAGFGSEGLKNDSRSTASRYGPKMSCRKPRFRVSRDVILKSSCSHHAYVRKRPPVPTTESSVTFAEFTAPSRNEAYAFPVEVCSVPLLKPAVWVLL